MKNIVDPFGCVDVGRFFSVAVDLPREVLERRPRQLRMRGYSELDQRVYYYGGCHISFAQSAQTKYRMKRRLENVGTPISMAYWTLLAWMIWFARWLISAVSICAKLTCHWNFYAVVTAFSLAMWLCKNFLLFMDWLVKLFQLGVLWRLVAAAAIFGSCAFSQSANAAINYLLITFPDGINLNSYAANRIRLAISSTCPAGYAIHLYGSQDIQGWYWQHNSGAWDGPATWGSSAPTSGMCVAGVPGSIKTTLIYAFSGSANAPTADTTISLGGASLDLQGFTTVAGGGDAMNPNGNMVVLPDNFAVGIGGGNGSGLSSMSIVCGIIGSSLAGTYYSGSNTYPSTRILLNSFGINSTQSVFGWVFLSGNSTGIIGALNKRHIYAIGY